MPYDRAVVDPPPPSAFPPPPATVYIASERTDGTAIAALILGVLAIPGALFSGIFGVIPGTAAIVLGLIARRRIKLSGGTLGGIGLATAGWILGICGVVIGVIVLVVLMLFLAAMNHYTY